MVLISALAFSVAKILIGTLSSSNAQMVGIKSFSDSIRGQLRRPLPNTITDFYLDQLFIV